MTEPHTVAYLGTLPKCDLDASHGDAYADANLGRGWGYVCKADFDLYGCKLGLGLGQRLVVGERPKDEYPSAVMEAADILGIDPSEVEL